jgi:plasmid stabilization system protein ParE
VPDFEITAPDGRKFRVSGPGTREEALAQVQAQYQPQQLRPGQTGEFQGPIATGQEMAESRAPKTETAMRKMGLLGSILSDSRMRGPVGVGEAALSMGTGMVAAPLNHAWNAAMEAGELPTGQPVGMYQPRTPEGQAVLSGVDKAMRLTGIPQALEKGMDLENPDPAVRATGNAMGAVLGAIPAVGPMRAAKARKAAIPTRPEIRAAADSAYARAESAGGMLPQQALGSFASKAEQILAKEGVDKTLHPMTMAALNRVMEDATRPGIAGHSVQGAETLRKVLLSAETAAYKAGGGDDARLAGQLLDEFDDFMDQALPASSAEYRTARALWNTQRKAQEIETIFERAKNQAGQFSMSGSENALRTQFKQLADNPRRFRRFSADEQAAILKVVRGGPVQNSLRLLGKLAPTGVVPGIAALTAEGLAPGAGFATAGAGIAGRAGASALRQRSARNVDELVRSGAIPAMPVSRRPGSQPLPQLGYLPAGAEAANALYDDRQRRNALTR